MYFHILKFCVKCSSQMLQNLLNSVHLGQLTISDIKGPPSSSNSPEGQKSRQKSSQFTSNDKSLYMYEL